MRKLVERGEVARLAAAHVMLLAFQLEQIRRLGPELEETDGQDNLELGYEGDLIPYIWRRQTLECRVVWHIPGERPRPTNPIFVHDVANESGHGNATMLDLCMAQKPDCRLICIFPEIQFREAQWIPVADDRVELLGLILEVSQRKRGIDSHHCGLERCHHLACIRQDHTFEKR